MASAIDVPAPPRAPPALSGIIFVLALSVALIAVPGRWLWLDELIGANMSMYGPWHTLITSLRFEPHPPLYYLGLSLWMQVAQQDAWLMTYNALWHAGATALLFHGATRLHGLRIGTAAAFLMAVSPALLAYATQVRMYSFLIFMLVWAWYAQVRWISGEGGRLAWVWLVLSQLMVAGSHAAGLAILSGVVLFGAARVLATGSVRRMLQWFLLEALTGFLALPGFAITVFREMDHVRPPGLDDVLAVWGFLAGGGSHPNAPALVLGAGVLLILTYGALRDGRLAIDIATLVFAPIALAVLVSHTVRAMWIERLFVPIAPFLSLSLARALLQPLPALPASGPTRMAQAAFVALALTWTGLGLHAQLTRPKGDGHRLAATALAGVVQPGDRIVLNEIYAFWSFLWYFDGPRWGDPLRAYILTPAWERLFQRVPAVAHSVLNQPPTDTQRVVRGTGVVLWDQGRQPAPSAEGDIYFVRLQGPSSTVFPGRRRTEESRHMQFVVERWVRSPE